MSVCVYFVATERHVRLYLTLDVIYIYMSICDLWSVFVSVSINVKFKYVCVYILSARIYFVQLIVRTPNSNSLLTSFSRLLTYSIPH